MTAMVKWDSKFNAAQTQAHQQALVRFDEHNTSKFQQMLAAFQQINTMQSSTLGSAALAVRKYQALQQYTTGMERWVQEMMVGARVMANELVLREISIKALEERLSEQQTYALATIGSGGKQLVEVATLQASKDVLDRQFKETLLQLQATERAREEANRNLTEFVKKYATAAAEFKYKMLDQLAAANLALEDTTDVDKALAVAVGLIEYFKKEVDLTEKKRVEEENKAIAFEQSAKSKEEQLQNLRTEVGELRAERETLRTQLAETKSALMASEAKLEGKEREIDRLNADIAVERAATALATQRKEKAEADLAEQLRGGAASSSEADALRNQKEEERAAKVKAEAELAEAKKKLALAQSEIDIKANQLVVYQGAKKTDDEMWAKKLEEEQKLSKALVVFRETAEKERDDAQVQLKQLQARVQAGAMTLGLTGPAPQLALDAPRDLIRIGWEGSMAVVLANTTPEPAVKPVAAAAKPPESKDEPAAKAIPEPVAEPPSNSFVRLLDAPVRMDTAPDVKEAPLAVIPSDITAQVNAMAVIQSSSGDKITRRADDPRRQAFFEDFAEIHAICADPVWVTATIQLLGPLYDPIAPLSATLVDIYHRAQNGSTELLFLYELLQVHVSLEKPVRERHRGRLVDCISRYVRVPVATAGRSDSHTSHIVSICNAVEDAVLQFQQAARDAQNHKRDEVNFYWTKSAVAADILGKYASAEGTKALYRHSEELREIYERNPLSYKIFLKSVAQNQEALRALRDICGMLWDAENLPMNFTALLKVPGGALLLDLLMQAINNPSWKHYIAGHEARLHLYNTRAARFINKDDVVKQLAIQFSRYKQLL